MWEPHAINAIKPYKTCTGDGIHTVHPGENLVTPTPCRSKGPREKDSVGGLGGGAPAEKFDSTPKNPWKSHGKTRWEEDFWRDTTNIPNPLVGGGLEHDFHFSIYWESSKLTN